MEGSLVAHAVTHGILDQGLYDEARDKELFDTELYGLRLDDAVCPKACLLDLEVALSLSQLLRKGNQGLGALERSTIIHRELAQKVAGFYRIRAREGGYRVERVEEEVGVYLGLQRLYLGAGGKLCLGLELVGRELGGEQLTEAAGDGQLRAVNLAPVTVVELEGTLDAIGHPERSKDPHR